MNFTMQSGSLEQALETALLTVGMLCYSKKKKKKEKKAWTTKYPVTPLYGRDVQTMGTDTQKVS